MKKSIHLSHRTYRWQCPFFIIIIIDNAFPFAQGIDAPFLGKVGLNIDTSGIKFGRFQDPRAALRNQIQNRVDVDPNAGQSARAPVQASTGGAISAKGMTYDDIKAKLVGTGRLFEDPDFKADGSSLFYSTPAPRGLEWKRPTVCSFT